MAIRVLLVEDDVRFAQSVIEFLEVSGFTVDSCNNGEQAFSLTQNNDYDVIVCDVNMPKLNGLEFCQKLREVGKSTPLIFASANIELEDKLLGFDKGADDYITKPFNLKELIARIQALSKRRSGLNKKLEINELELEVDFSTRQVTRASNAIQLPPSSWKLFEKLAREYPQAVSKSELEYAVWGEESPESNSLKVHIHTLRKLIDKPFERTIVHTVSGFGLKLGTSK